MCKRFCMLFILFCHLAAANMAVYSFNFLLSENVSAVQFVQLGAGKT